MINMYSSAIYLQLQDQYGNKKAPGSDLIASLSSTLAGFTITPIQPSLD
jgi:hypothetical protein